MSTVLVVDSTLANEVKTIETDGIFIEHREDNLDDPAEWPIEGPAQIIATVERADPDALVVDVDFGRDRYSPLEAVAILLRGQERKANPPATVLVAQKETPILRRRARELGCYWIIDISAVGRVSLAKEVIVRVLAAKAWRRGRGAWPLDESFLPISLVRGALSQVDHIRARLQLPQGPRPRGKKAKRG